MALTFTNVIDGAIADWKPANGPRLVVFDMTIGDAGVDYAVGAGVEGLDLNGNIGKTGLHKIFMVLAATLRVSAGNMVALLPLYDANTGKLRLCENAAAVGEFPDGTVDTDINDGDIVRMAIIGV
jgi:hypothetical protein